DALAVLAALCFSAVLQSGLANQRLRPELRRFVALIGRFQWLRAVQGALLVDEFQSRLAEHFQIVGFEHIRICFVIISVAKEGQLVSAPPEQSVIKNSYPLLPQQQQQQPASLLQHLVNASKFYVAQVDSWGPSTCFWRLQRDYCIKTSNREATLYHLTSADPSSKASNWLTGYCQLPDGQLRRAFQLRRVYTCPMFAADLLPLPVCTACAEILCSDYSLSTGLAADVTKSLGLVRSAWGPVKGFWLSRHGSNRRYQISTERLMNFCWNGDTSTEVEPLEVAHRGSVHCVAAVRWHRHLRTVYCDNSGMDVSFTEAAAELAAEDRLLLLCGLIYAWEQIG
uniref:HET domain-containing protein n=1 Tax=Macrostomum lignano TaxID=282301 RepID=A0A1I8JHX1_9PLAT